MATLAPTFLIGSLFLQVTRTTREHSDSVVECLTRGLGVSGTSLTGVAALCP